MRRLIAITGMLLHAQCAQAQDERPTGYPRSANEGSDKAITVSAVYTADIRSNVLGGVRRGIRYLDNLDLQIAVDADRLVGWHVARMFVYGIYDNGRSLSAPTGDVQTISNIETSVRAVRLFEAWVEQDAGPDASVKVALYNLNSEFDTTQSGGLFLLSSHGIGADIAQSGRNGPSIFPVTSLAVRGEGRLGENWLARVAVLDGVPGDPAHPKATVVKLWGRDGALIIGEVNFLEGGTKAAVGTWLYTARFDDVAGPSAASPRRGNKGAYVFVEQRITGTRSDDAVGLAGWLRFGVADTRVNAIGSYLGGGLVYTGLIDRRPGDQAGISFAAAGFGDRYRRGQALAGNQTNRREIVFEAAYSTLLASWLTIEPDIQYVLNPGGDRRLHDAVVVGFRVKIGR